MAAPRRWSRAWCAAGSPRWIAARGEGADEGAAYRIGSITKTFTAVLVLRLRDEGRLDLGDPIGRHLAEAVPGDPTFVLTRAPYDRSDVVPGGVDPDGWRH